MEQIIRVDYSEESGIYCLRDSPEIAILKQPTEIEVILSHVGDMIRSFRDNPVKDWNEYKDLVYLRERISVVPGN